MVIYGSSIRTDRKSSIGSVKNFLRSVNCISLVGLRRERRHCLSIQRDNTNCKSLILKRCSRFIAEFFSQNSSTRAPRSLVQLWGAGGLKLVRLRCQGKELKLRRHAGGKFGFIDYEFFRSLQSIIKVNIWRISM